MSDSKTKTALASKGRSAFAVKDWRETRIEISDSAKEFDPIAEVLGRGARPAKLSGRAGRSYVEDAAPDILSRYVSPDTPVLTALGIFHDELVANQKDESAYSAWVILRTRLGVTENPNATIADVDTESIVNLVRTLEANLVSN
jgi:hypothetical protein